MVEKDAHDSMKGSWYTSMAEHRFRVQTDLQANPSFKSSLEETLLIAYKDALKLAIKEGKKANFGVRMPDIKEYPLQCPFTIQQILDDEFYG